MIPVASPLILRRRIKRKLPHICFCAAIKKKRRAERRERKAGRERREKKTTSTEKMLTFDSPQLSPPVKIGGAFQGASPSSSSVFRTAEKRRWKERREKKKCH